MRQVILVFASLGLFLGTFGQARSDLIYWTDLGTGDIRRANLNGKPAARLFIAADFGHGIPDAPDRAVLQRAHQLIGAIAVVGEQSPIDVLAQRLDLGGDQIATDPSPDRLERDTGNTADAFMIGAAVDQERFQWRKEQPRGVANARHFVGVAADRAAQFLQYQIVAGALFAAQQAAFELLHQHRPRRGREGAEIFTQPFDGLSIARHGRMTVLNRRLRFYAPAA